MRDAEIGCAVKKDWLLLLRQSAAALSTSCCGACAQMRNSIAGFGAADSLWQQAISEVLHFAPDTRIGFSL
jgi:hypothetical protein